jgi:hypothetical protein
VVTISDQGNSPTNWQPANTQVFCGISNNSKPGAPDPNSNCVPETLPAGCVGNTYGKINGKCNSDIVVSATNQGPSRSSPGICKFLGLNGFNDWYLPALCELAYSRSADEILCGSQTRPVIQNVYSSLFNKSGMSFSPNYWTSTANSGIIRPLWIWYVAFSGNVNGSPAAQPVSRIDATPINIRCVRKF